MKNQFYYVGFVSFCGCYTTQKQSIYRCSSVKNVKKTSCTNFNSMRKNSMEKLNFNKKSLREQFSFSILTNTIQSCKFQLMLCIKYLYKKQILNCLLKLQKKCGRHNNNHLSNIKYCNWKVMLRFGEYILSPQQPLVITLWHQSVCSGLLLKKKRNIVLLSIAANKRFENVTQKKTFTMQIKHCAF